MEIGLLIIRLALGLTLAAHGAQKLFGMFGGYGLQGTGGFFESIGFKPGKPLAFLAGFGETVGGIALAIGFLTPIAAALLISTMIVALAVHWPKGFFAQGGGYEYPLIIGAVAAGLAFTGAGTISVDAALDWELFGRTWGLIGGGLGIVGALPALGLRAMSHKHTAATA